MSMASQYRDTRQPAVVPAASLPGPSRQPGPSPSVFFFEGCDFETFPAGGQLATARSLIKIYGGRLALVGMCRGGTPTGRWIRKELHGNEVWFFGVCRREVSAKRPLVPARLTFYLGLQRHRKAILALGCEKALIQAPEALLAVSRWGMKSICYRFPGVENPLRISRYGWARKVATLFERLTFTALRRADIILASADEAAIRQLVARSEGRLARERITQMPTCVDLSAFRPAPLPQAREFLGIASERLVLATCGRVGRFKGWDLLLDCIEVLRRSWPDPLLIFIGDGEDRGNLEASVAARGLAQNVRITGFQSPAGVAQYLNSANVAVFGSYAEGWSVAMLEALACGKPLVSTKVSGVADLIADGENGFVLDTRDPQAFATAVERALRLPGAGGVSRSIAGRFGLSEMGERLGRVWEPLRYAGSEEATR